MAAHFYYSNNDLTGERLKSLRVDGYYYPNKGQIKVFISDKDVEPSSPDYSNECAQLYCLDSNNPRIDFHPYTVRGAGFGTLAMNTLIQIYLSEDLNEIRANQCISGQISTNRDNNSSRIAFYQKHGFTIDGNFLSAYPNTLMVRENKYIIEKNGDSETRLLSAYVHLNNFERTDI